MGEQRDAWWSRPRLALALAALLHVALVLAVGHWRAPNLWENGAIADALLAGRGFSVPTPDATAGAFEPTSWQAPGYPLLLWALWSIFGKTCGAHLALGLLQALATASVVLPLRALAARWYGERAGLTAQWLAALLPLHAWYSTRVHHTGLVLALAPWALLACVRLRDAPSRRDVVLAGLSLAALGLLQPVLLGALGVYALGLLALALRRSRAQARPVALALLVCAAGLAPWTVRNALVHGRLVPIKDSFGKELWIGNNPRATGTAYAPGGLEPLEAAHPPAAAARPDLREAERFAAMGAEARAFIAAEPRAFVTRTASKVLWLWTWVPADLVRHGLGGEAVAYRWLHVASWLGLCALALLGARDLPREHAGALVACAGTASVVYGLTHVGQARFRGEVEWVLVPLAAHGLARLIASRS